MAIEKVQLKRQEIIDGNISLININPVSSTNSINDSTTGVTLTQTLARLWNAINNKLSRVVNSVNGRTGVVVLKSSDVGLGNVDNVSYTDIKKWVTDRLIIEFGNKRIKLFDSLQEIDLLIATNDLIYRDTPFYAENGFNADKKSYIGYIYLDTGTSTLAYTYKVINTIGYTDNSIIYDELVVDTDLRNGGIGVNIAAEEDSLEIFNGSTKVESGLRIIKDKIVGDVYWYDGVYGDGTISDSSALLYYNSTSTPVDAKTVRIFIDDIQIVSTFKIRQTAFKVGDLLICNFKDYRTNNVLPAGMSYNLIGRNTSIGRIVTVPSPNTGEGLYTIKFYTLNQFTGWGLQKLTNHQAGVPGSEITHKLATGYIAGMSINGNNVSGLQVYKNTTDLNPINDATASSITENMKWSVLPQGVVKIFDDDEKATGGMFITPDMSMCVIPFYGYGEGNANGDTYINDDDITRPYGSKVVGNWAVKSPSDLSDASVANGALKDACLIGLNLTKSVDPTSTTHDSLMRFGNMSGLRVITSSEYDTQYPTVINEEWLGKNHGEYTGNMSLDKHSGGLSINIGKFLEIEPDDYQGSSDEYYQGGKVNVRIGGGLTEEPRSYDGSGNRLTGNRIMVKIQNVNGGLDFDAGGNLIVKNYNPELRKLVFIDTLGGTITYNPLPVNLTGQQILTINLGSGLKIT